MSSLTPFLLVATLVAAVGAAGVSQARPVHHGASMTALRAAAGRATVVESAVLVLAAR